MRLRSLFVLAAAALLALTATPAWAMYIPSLGRFTQRDSQGTVMVSSNVVGATGATASSGFIPRDSASQYADGMNVYQYVSSDPIIYVDPLGTKKTEIKFTVTRNGGTYATLGNFTMAPPGIKTVNGATLEPRRGKYNMGFKLKTYPIPSGTYNAIATNYDGHFALRLKKVTGFKRIYVHVGNWPWDTDGCIVVGGHQEVNKPFRRHDMKKRQNQWDKYKKLKFFKVTTPGKAGITDYVGPSIATLNALKVHYHDAVKKYGKNCTVVTVIIK